MIISSLGSLILALLPPPSSSATTATLLAHALLSQPTTSSSFYMLAAAPSFPSSSAKAVQARQVLLFSVANTLARLVGGFLADYLSAPLNTVVVLPSRLQHSGRRRWLGSSSRFRRPRISKISFFLAVLLPLGLVYLWAAVGGLTNVGLLPILTISVGLSYGLVFTLAPALIAQVFGLQTFGRCVRPRPLTPFLPTLP
jgi:MFS family permease